MNNVNEIFKWINYICACNQVSPVEQNREVIKQYMKPIAHDLQFDKHSYETALQLAINQGELVRKSQM